MSTELLDLTASRIPVREFKNPPPWCTVTMLTPPVSREWASAMHAPPISWREAVNCTPALMSALVMWKLPLPTTPNTWPAPAIAKVLPTASATEIRSPTRASFPIDVDHVGIHHCMGLGGRKPCIHWEKRLFNRLKRHRKKHRRSRPCPHRVPKIGRASCRERVRISRVR